MHSKQPREVLVTGASGFVGQHLCSHLMGKGYNVRGTYRELAPPDGFPESMDWVRIADIGPETHWEDALDGMDLVVHLAALAHQIGEHADGRLDEYMRVNALGTQRLAEMISASSRVERFVFVSSVGAVKTFSKTRIEEGTVCEPDTDYGRSKKAAEIAVEEVLYDSAVEWCIIRPVLVYGPGNPGNMARLQKLIGTHLPLPFGRIDNARSFLYVGNLVDAIERCLWHPNANQRCFLVSDGIDVSTPALAAKIARHMGKRPILLPVPAWALNAVGRGGDLITKMTGRAFPMNSYVIERLLSSLTVDISSIRQTIDWTPPYTFDEGLAHTLQSPET